MKNLRTIMTLLVLTVITFSCQTNDELIEIEALQKKESLNESTGRETFFLSVEVLVYFGSDATDEEKNAMRTAFMTHPSITFNSVESCSDREYEKETWTLEGISYEDFLGVADNLGYGAGVSIFTGIVGDDPDKDPIGGSDLDYHIYFNANCSTIFN